MIRLLQPRVLHPQRRQHLPRPLLAPLRHPVVRLCGKPASYSGLLEVLGYSAGCFSFSAVPLAAMNFMLVPPSIGIPHNLVYFYIRATHVLSS
jgi:hypothetical protein